MARDDIQKQIDQQNAENYGEDSPVGGTAGGAEPLDIDDAIEEVTGNTPDLDEPTGFVSNQIDQDEEDVQRGQPPIGSDVDEEDEVNFKDENEELSQSGFHVVGEDDDTLE